MTRVGISSLLRLRDSPSSVLSRCALLLPVTRCDVSALDRMQDALLPLFPGAHQNALKGRQLHSDGSDD